MGILKGCVPFYSDLTRKMPSDLPFSMYFIESTSYCGQIQKERIISNSIAKEKFQGKKIVLVDELYDNGETLESVKHYIGLPKEDIITVCLMRKAKHTHKNPLPDLCAYVLPDVWLVGYGLDDVDGHFRHWHKIYAYKKVNKEDEIDDDVIFYNENAYRGILEGRVKEPNRRWMCEEAKRVMNAGWLGEGQRVIDTTGYRANPKEFKFSEDY